MDGNRGAKGSIKDRLISMLYRIRYAKKVKKEDEYEIAKKEKALSGFFYYWLFMRDAPSTVNSLAVPKR